MKRYFLKVYFSGVKDVEIEAEDLETAIELAEEKGFKIDYDVDNVEVDYDGEEDLEEVIDYSEYMELQMLEEENE